MVATKDSESRDAKSTHFATLIGENELRDQFNQTTIRLPGEGRNEEI